MSMTATLHDSELTRLFLARLSECVEPASQLYARQIRRRSWAPTLGTECITSTAICLIGQSRARLDTGGTPKDLTQACRRMAEEIRARRCSGPIGLLLWAGSALRAASPGTLLEIAGYDPATLERVVPTLTTMEVAWLVSGLLHADAPTLGSVRRSATQELLQRFTADTNLFRHAAASASLAHRIRGCIANFADQIYPVQALAFAAIAQADAEARLIADRCASRLVSLQGPLGQWWWHYDSSRGCVAERYPVYSVHQHGMAPMALHALAKAGGSPHVEAVERSRGWLANNELGINLMDRESGVIWRSIEREETVLQKSLRQVRLVLGFQPANSAPPRLRLNHEMRPYEWGWLLYANALDAIPPPEGHII